MVLNCHRRLAFVPVWCYPQSSPPSSQPSLRALPLLPLPGIPAIILWQTDRHQSIAYTMDQCLSVCHKPLFCRNGWMYWAVFSTETVWLILCCVVTCREIRVSLVIRVLPSVLKSELSWFVSFCRHDTSIVASVVNLVRPTTVASLWQWVSTVVCNTFAMMQCIAWLIGNS